MVVTTNTLNLQEQLFHKDIPNLAEILPLQFTSKIFKGRQNYLCLRRLEELLLGLNPQKGLQEYAEALRSFSEQTETGDRLDLPESVPDQVWQAVCCQKESCPEEDCPFFKRCFYWQLRHALRKAHIIVTNHALLLADLQTENTVLPKYDAVIIDEAHNLEDVATSAFSPQVMNMYYRTGLQLYFNTRSVLPLPEAENLRAVLDRVIDEANRYFPTIREYIGEFSLRIDEKNRHRFAQTDILERLKKVQETLQDLHLGDDSEGEALAKNLRQYTNTLAENIALILAADNPHYVFWGEMQYNEPSLQAAPLSVAEHLEEKFFSQVKSVILTSATLTTEKSFAYFKERIGLNGAQELILGSPFNYAKQAVLCVPTQAQSPRSPKFDWYNAYLILHTAARTKGGVLALFTSYSAMEETAELMAEKLEEVGYSLFVQGDDLRQNLVEKFIQTPQSILLGTNSFWEGVDIPGDALKAVVITRLPFAVPDRPVTAARLEAIDQRGGNSFREYSIPQAILRLKQGFGRLIRSSQDRGGVVILDNRILTASYGKAFLESLPPAKFTRNLDDLKIILET